MKDRPRETFDADELAIVLSHYPVGVIESVTEFPRGSRRSPKVGIVSSNGKFLLKRRDPERTHPVRIRFSHRLQTHLASQGFPLPRLVSPSGSDDSARPLLTLRDRMYELFEYVSGHSYRGTEGETFEAGRILAIFHRVSRSFQQGEDCPTGDYHDSNTVRTGLNTIPSSISAHESVFGRQAELLGAIHMLSDAYDEAAAAVQQIGVAGFPEQVIHSDWHPGNMLFRNDVVAAVIDYDSARLSRRILDVANGVLQFSILTGDRPEVWPDHLDEPRVGLFLTGYQAAEPLAAEERRCIPHLMIEALIAECVVPIAMTGSFGRWQGYRFMQMVRRKVIWLRQNAARLAP